ncbi:hypothetical protein [Corallococcus sp. AB038B]|uniref:hypothetical protein n=1 Tax=Corallococcus sp. AB038B TaxID=2316718 RepID=UPI000ECDE0E7|nr:hypothetical protein [Corallococcus sp. AB038B]RKI04776.1 hypothetical protein D7Y04_07730 [Corallococcus sp. AB038B]
MTTYNIDFDFSSSDQTSILKKLQAQNYTLLGYKGAQGPNQLSVGVPTWFSVPFGNIFGLTDISYTPVYKIYVSTQANIAVDTTIVMQSLSAEMELGGSLTFNPDGTFTAGGVSGVSPGGIGLYNNRPSGTPTVTVGLAGRVNTPNGEAFLPFCGFTLNPQNSIVMTPLEQILLVAAQKSLKSGNVQATAAAPGCTFAFSNSAGTYQLMVKDSTFEITNLPKTAAVTPVTSGSLISMINE